LIKRRSRLVRAMAVVPFAACVALPSVAAARIVIDKGIDRVDVGASMASAERILGKPSVSYTCRGIIGPCGPGEPGFSGHGKPSSIRYWDYNSKGLDLIFMRGKVQALTTTSTRERTSRGIGPGVSVARTKQTYTNGAIAAFSGGQGWWLPAAPKPNALFTTFVGSTRRHPTKLGGDIAIVEVGRWLGYRYGCEFFDC
jgi:hypothetical protein